MKYKIEVEVQRIVRDANAKNVKVAITGSVRHSFLIAEFLFSHKFAFIYAV